MLTQFLLLQIHTVVISIKTIVIGQTSGVRHHLLSGIATKVPLRVNIRDQEETMGQAMVSLNLGCLCSLSVEGLPIFFQDTLGKCAIVTAH